MRRDTMSSSALSVVTHCFTYYYPVLVVNFHKVGITQSWIWIGSIHGLGWVEIRLMRSFGANWWYERLHVYCRGSQYTSCVSCFYTYWYQHIRAICSAYYRIVFKLLSVDDGLVSVR